MYSELSIERRVGRRASSRFRTRFMAKQRQPKRNSVRQSAGHAATLVDAPSRRIEAARGLWNSGQRADALSLLAEAVRQEPNNVRTYVMAARAYAEAFDFESMERVHAKLIQRAPRHPGVHHYIGETYAMLKLPERALERFRESAQLPGAGPPTWMELANLCERAHQLDEAEQLIGRTVDAGFDLPQVSLVRARIERRQRRTDQAEATLRNLIAKLPADSEWSCQAWSDIALIKDDAGDFAGAVEAIGNCKRIQGRHEARYWETSERIQRQTQELFGALTQDDLRRWRDEAAALPPQRVALLTGFPRSGTTLLEQLLDAHPDLVSSEERDFVGKELLHSITAGRGSTPLIDGLNDRAPVTLAADRRQYFQAMEYFLGQPIEGRMHLDKNPSYNLVLPLVLRWFPETRLIVALRDPRDVVLSCYMRYLPLNAVSVHFLDVKRTAEKYAFDMNAWLDFRELVATPWCELRYEDTVADAAGQARKALDTLGLVWSDDVLDYRDRLSAGKRVTSPTYEAVAQPIYTRAIGRWKNYEQLLEPAFAPIEPFLREFEYTK
jgi:Tfp pilus assembly protein PilF